MKGMIDGLRGFYISSHSSLMFVRWLAGMMVMMCITHPRYSYSAGKVSARTCVEDIELLDGRTKEEYA